MQQLMELTPLPVLLMRTVIQSVAMYPKLIGFVMNIMQRLIMKQVWWSKPEITYNDFLFLKSDKEPSIKVVRSKGGVVWERGGCKFFCGFRVRIGARHTHPCPRTPGSQHFLLFVRLCSDTIRTSKYGGRGSSKLTMLDIGGVLKVTFWSDVFDLWSLVPYVKVYNHKKSH